MKTFKEFIGVDDVLSLIHQNIKRLEQLPNEIIKIKRNEISHGDDYDNEVGYEFVLKFYDNTSYIIGNTKITEDRDDYAQADSWEQSHCIDKKEGKNASPSEIMRKLRTILSVETCRDLIIDNILG